MQVFYSRRIGSAPVAPSLRTDASGQPSEELLDVPTQATIYGAGKLVGRLSPDWTIGAMSAITGANHVTVLDNTTTPVSYTHLRAHETGRNLVCRLLLEK